MSEYHSKPLDAFGNLAWDDDEHDVWQRLIERQSHCVEGRACKAYLQGLERLGLSHQYAPQLSDINPVLQETTGWQVTPVPALINFERFFTLLAHKQFPIATFLRRKEDLDYLQEPDFFHEVFGHCAMLTNPKFAQLTNLFGQLGLAMPESDRVYLARLYWFTVEFGLIKEDDEFRIFGGGILSSPGETLRALESAEVRREPFHLLNVLRTSYRIDEMQPLYYYLNDFSQLFRLLSDDFSSNIEQAKSLGMLTVSDLIKENENVT